VRGSTRPSTSAPFTFMVTWVFAIFDPLLTCAAGGTGQRPREGLDQSAALYEWNYQRQLLAIQAHRGDKADTIEDQIFSEKYLLERPLLAAIRRAKPPVLLIDEIDRADDEPLL
jgi:hypothetical protein